jgi:hypothetical protein
MRGAGAAELRLSGVTRFEDAENTPSELPNEPSALEPDSRAPGRSNSCEIYGARVIGSSRPVIIAAEDSSVEQ